MIETALTAGLTSVGMDVFLVGPIPTPAVGMLARSMRADLGVMISASHNPFEDNGIKFFGPDGFKLSDAAEEAIEALLEDEPELAEPALIGRAQRIDDHRARYMEFTKTTFPRGQRLDGLKVVVDCANGAGYRTAPEVLWELGAEVVPIAVAPDGFNINKGCGSTNPEAAAAAVVAHGADLGISLDGDADRVLVIDETGAVADGDQFMALIADRWAAEGKLAKNTLVATVMSNLGLERHLAAQGLGLVRTAVGDRYVVEAMREGGYNLGGEQSGHIVMTDHVTTGDGLIAALQFLSAMVETGRRASELAQDLPGISAGSDQRALSQGGGAARRGERARRNLGRREPDGQPGPARHPQVRHRAAGPDHGRVRRPRAPARDRRRHRGRGGAFRLSRGQAMPKVNGDSRNMERTWSPYGDCIPRQEAKRL